MNWKLFLTAFASALVVSFPQNIIGCGPDTDPYDYYTSFFHQGLSETKGYQPFYYTGYNFLYDEHDEVATSDLLATEWAGYCGVPVTDRDAKLFVTRFAWKDLNNLYYHLEKNQPLKIPDSVSRNSMTSYFRSSKDLEALGYIMYAKQVEPYVLGWNDNWEPLQRDSLKMAKLVKNGQQLYAVAKKDFIKTKFAYQVLRLAHYSGRYSDVISWYDEYAPNISNDNVLQPLCLALKAGALFRTGRQPEAAYLFSKCFNASQAKRVSNYLGFEWSVDSKASRDHYLALCKNNKEKANMLGLFAMQSVGNELETMKRIQQLDPGNEMLEVLAVREINKLEETYFTPSIRKENGGKTFYYSWNYESMDSIYTEAQKETRTLSVFFDQLAQSGKSGNGGLFETAAAYTAFMNRDYSAANSYIKKAEGQKLSAKVKDQLRLTQLLVTINERPAVDAAFEEQLLPSVQWLEEKVRAESPIRTGSGEVWQWKVFYRNLMSEILAKRYHKQGDLDKETLVIGCADWITRYKSSSPGEGYYYTYANGINFLRDNLDSKQVEKLYSLMTNKSASKYEQYLITHNRVKTSDVTDFAGTAYLRERNYEQAINWFGKQADKKGGLIKTNPFIDILYDREEALPSEAKFATTKLAYAQEMLRLQKAVETDKANAHKHYYKMALGLYNATYYGHAWQLVEYYRSGSDGYCVPKDANAFRKEYYSAEVARLYFEKAMNSTADRNFKARCIFMMGKCSQKQIRQPQYDDFPNNYDQYDVASKKYYAQFMDNKYFPQLVKEYGNTAFYKEAFNSCSYLRDFVKRK